MKKYICWSYNNNAYLTSTYGFWDQENCAQFDSVEDAETFLAGAANGHYLIETLYIKQ